MYQNKVIFLGAGDKSKKECRSLHRKLTKAITYVSGLQQQGLQGSEVNQIEIRYEKEEIKKIYKEIGEKLGVIK